MSVLVHAEIDGERLDDDAILQESLLILVGGDETTRHVISGGMEALLRNPDERRKLVADPALDADRGRGDAALGDADPEHEPHRDARRRARRRRRSAPATRCCRSIRPPTATSGVFAEAARVSRRPPAERAPRVRPRRALLPRREPRAPRAQGDVRDAATAGCPTSRSRPTAPLTLRPSNFIVGIASMPVRSRAPSVDALARSTVGVRRRDAAGAWIPPSWTTCERRSRSER